MSYTVLITGSSSGFGALTVDTLLKKGHTVVASMRDPEGRNKKVADRFRSASALVVEMDVTDDKSVEAGMAQSLSLSGGLDVVVNNAGVGVIGLQETFTPEDWKRLFELNVFGVQRVNRAVLPHFRQKKAGLLVHISSLLGRMALPFYGPYNASKWALEALAENYRVELSGLGIQSCVVEPGGFPTSFMDRLMSPSDSDRDESYGDFAQSPKMLSDNFAEALAANPAQDPQIVADAVLELIEKTPSERPFRTVVDTMGMGTAINPYNEQLEQITKGIYANFGMGHMLELKSAQRPVHKG